MNASPALIVFAREPVLGRVKTRLQSALSAQDTLRLYRAFLDDAARQYASLDLPIRWYVDSCGSSTSTVPISGPRASTHAQRGADLGMRMANALAETFAAGYSAAMIVGTDHPTLPTEFVQLAGETLLKPSQLVIGPSDDGGYYLIGMSRLYPGVFDGMKYSHADVFNQTMDRAARTDAEITILPAWYDVDTPDNLARLKNELAMQPNGTGPTATRAVLESLRPGATK